MFWETHIHRVINADQLHERKKCTVDSNWFKWHVIFYLIFNENK